MIIMVIAEQYPAGSLDELDEFRKQKYNYLYFCSNCSRSFDTVAEVTACKFCGMGDVDRIGTKDEPTMYNYYCTVCEKNFTTREKVKRCEFCGNKYIHIKELHTDQKRDEFRTRLWRFFSFLKKPEDGQKPVQKASGKTNPGFLKKLQKPDLKVEMPRFRFFSKRSEEELPTK